MQVAPVKRQCNRIHQTNGEKKEKLPEFYCSSCAKQHNGYCDCFQRHVDTHYNKCFNHSNYIPVATKFKEYSNLDELMEQEALKQKKLYA